MINIIRSKVFRYTMLAGAMSVAACGWYADNVKMADDDNSEKWYPITLQPIVHSIFLNGRIEPDKKNNIAAPFTGEIKAIYVRNGQRVLAGDTLAELDASLFESEIRSAEAERLKAYQAVQQIKNWSESVSVLRAKRSIVSSEKSLAMLQRDLKESSALFERGIIARNEVDGLNHQIQVLKTELMSARNELEELLIQGDKHALKIAEMGLVSAEVKLNRLEQLKNLKTITAPFTGVVLPIENNEDTAAPGTIQEGGRVVSGQVLFQIISSAHLKAAAQVAETDLKHLKPGQKVTLKGDGFQGEQLTGRLMDISYLPDHDYSVEQAAMFPVVVQIDTLNERQQQLIRPGMSVQIAIETYRNNHAAVVPHEAITTENGKTKIRYRQAAKDVATMLEVETGRVVSNGVEILGVEHGEVLLSDK